MLWFVRITTKSTGGSTVEKGDCKVRLVTPSPLPTPLLPYLSPADMVAVDPPSESGIDPQTRGLMSIIFDTIKLPITILTTAIAVLIYVGIRRLDSDEPSWLATITEVSNGVITLEEAQRWVR